MNTNQSGPKPYVAEVLMTPEKARELLAGNRNNRALRRSTVEFLKDEIRNDRWVLVPDAIAVTKDGRLLNGQHRLTAVAEAGVSVRCLLATGMPAESFVATDRGIGRTVADVTGLEPEFASDVTLLLQVRNGISGKKTSPQTVLDHRDLWRPIWETLMAPGVSFGKRRGASSSSLRLGVGLRWATEKSAEKRAYILRQYTAYGKAEVEVMSKCVASLFRRFGERAIPDLHANTGVARIHSVAHYWLHFDPDKREIVPLMKDKAATLRLIAEYVRLLDDAYIAGPARDSHPYVFTERPKMDTALHGAAAAKVANANRS